MGSVSNTGEFFRGTGLVPAATLIALVVLLGVGCGEQEPSASGTSVVSAPAAAMPLSERVRPLVEELTRLKVIIDRESLDVAAFRHAVGEVEVQLGRAQAALLAGDADNPSWQHLTKAVEFIRRADKNLARQEVLAEPPPAVRSADGRPPGLNDLDAMNRHTLQLVDQIKELALVSAETPKALAAASGEILMAQIALRDNP